MDLDAWLPWDGDVGDGWWCTSRMSGRLSARRTLEKRVHRRRHPDRSARGRRSFRERGKRQLRADRRRRLHW